MSASTMSISANQTAVAKRTPILSTEKKSNFDYHPTESYANGEPSGTSKDPIRAESILDRSHGQDLGPVTRRPLSAATGTNTTATQRRTKKVATGKPEKARWKKLVRVFAKQLAALLILVGLIQVARKVISNVYPPSSEMAFSGLENRIAEVDSLVKATTNSIQVQVDLLDKKMEREANSLRQELNTKSSLFQNELKKIESRTESLEKTLEEVNAKPFVSKDELERIYEELKKGKLDDSRFSETSIDELRAYARDIMEKEIEKHAADGLGRADYALASSGAFVVQHSDPYLIGKGSNWFATSSRRAHTNAVKMLSPSFGEPGQCFPLKGSNGFVQIRLKQPIVPEAFTLEHVAKNVAYDRSSAPKDCRVSGWLHEKGQESSLFEAEKMQLLAEFTYDLERSNAQTFNILDSSSLGVVNTIRLDFTSNHGSNSHTCIYRFRVHGHATEPVSVVESQS